jgi:hypothetical protein
MIFLHHARLVILSQPKTGTTALDNALAPRASIAISNPPQLKHMQYHKFMRFVAPWIKAQVGLDRADYDVVSVMREPIDWVGSWYRYRTRDALKGGGGKKQRGNYAGNVSFETFVQEVLKPKAERERFAYLGSPCSVALDQDGSVGCDRIYPYEDLSGLYALIEERTRKPIELAQMNVSPAGDTAVSDQTRAKLRAQWSFAFDLHDSLKRDGSLDARFKVAGQQQDGDEDEEVA